MTCSCTNPMWRVEKARKFQPLAAVYNGSVLIRIVVGFTPRHAQKRAWRWIHETAGV